MTEAAAVDAPTALNRLWHVRVSHLLTQADVPHVLLKGATWTPSLRLAGHAPIDVDVLIAPEEFRRAVDVLGAAGFANAMPGVGEDEISLHSTVLRCVGGPETDVHRSLPGLDQNVPRTWSLLAAQVVPLDLGHTQVPVLPEHLQVLVAAAGAARDGGGSRAARRVVQASGTAKWADVARDARALGADGTLRAGLQAAGLLGLADSLGLGEVPYRFREARSAGERRLEEVLAQPWRRQLGVVRRELWPTRGFLAMTQSGVPVVTARRRHLVRVLREGLPALVRMVRSRRT
jgi:hypothetical protein